MGCNTCGGGNAGYVSGTYTARIPRVPDPNCTVTIEMLIQWRAILNCIKTAGKFEQAHLSEPELNTFLGLVQSAINYPDDYCYYMDRLTSFQQDKLPLIVGYVPECI
jgi:hypothetical protein